MQSEKYISNSTPDVPVKSYAVIEKGFFWKEYDLINESQQVEFTFKPSYLKLEAVTATGSAIADMYKPKGSCLVRNIKLDKEYFNDKIKYNSITFTPTLVPALGYPYTVLLKSDGAEDQEFHWTRKNLIGCVYQYTSKSQPDVILAEFQYQIGCHIIGSFKFLVDMDRVDQTVATITLAYVLQRNLTAEAPTDLDCLN